MKKKFIFWLLILILTLGVTISSQYLFKAYRLCHLENRKNHFLYIGRIGQIEFLFATFILPVYLAKIYILINRRFQFIGNFTIYCVLAIICILVTSWLNYLIWWETEGKTLKIIEPFYLELRDLVGIGLSFQLIVSFTVIVIALRLIRKK